MSQTFYTNTDTNNLIKENQILQDTENGVVITLQNNWKLIPEQSLKSDNKPEGYFTDEAPVLKEQKKDSDPHLIYSDTADSVYTEQSERRYGFTGLKIGTKQTAPVSGVCSDPIRIDRASYITIKADISGEENGSVEISVIDNMDEIPILWNNNWTVHKERLFSEQPTRFLIDQEQKIVLYEDNRISKKEYTKLSVDDFQNHVYAITYTTAKNPCLYYPLSDVIRVKILIRQYRDAEPYVTVENLVIQQYGVSPQWNSTV